jgi:alpha-mannosidase
VTIHERSVNTPEITSTILLNDEEKSVTFDNELQKETTLTREGIYFAFPFNAAKPKVEYQGATAWVNPETDMLPGANCEWFATQAGVRVSGTGQSVGWASVDAPLITLDHINRGLWPTTIQIKDGTVFSYVMNNYWYTDAPAQQDGRFRFRYVLTSGDTLSQADTTQLAIGARSPLYALPMEHKEWTPILPQQGQSFVSASPAGVSIVAMRPAPGSERRAYLLRVQNATAQAADAHILFSGPPLEDAYIGSVLGDHSGSVDWAAHQVNLPMAPFDVKTLVVRVGAAPGAGPDQK